MYLFLHHIQLLVRVAPQVRHVLPICNDAVPHRVTQLENAPQLAGIVTDEEILDHRRNCA